MNKMLVKGQQIMNEAAKDSSISSFAESFTKQYGLNIEAEKNEKIKVGKWADKVGIPENILKIDPSDRDTVLEWNQGMRDQFVEAMRKYEKSGDDKDKAVADKILIKVKNLDNQLNIFQQDKKEYLKVYKANLLMPGHFDSEFYSNAYTEENQIQINDDGNITFKSDGRLLNDVAGEYKLQNKQALVDFDEISGRAITMATSDARSSTGAKNFNLTKVRKNIKSKLSGDAQGVISLSQMDLNEFDDKNITFSTEYQNKTLPQEIYEMAKAAGLDENDPKWMSEVENNDVLTEMISTYVAGGIEQVYENNYNEAFGIEAERGFLTAAKGQVKSAIGELTPDQSTNLYDLLNDGKTKRGEKSTSIGDYEVTLNNNGTFNISSDAVVRQEDIDNPQSKYFKKNSLIGTQKIHTVNDETAVMDFFKIEDSDYRRITGGKNKPEPKEKKKEEKQELPTKPKGIDRSYFKGLMTSERVLEIEKLYPGLKMVKTNPNSINSTKYTLTFNGQNPQEIDTKRVENRLFDGPSKSKNEFDNYINKYIK